MDDHCLTKRVYIDAEYLDSRVRGGGGARGRESSGELATPMERWCRRDGGEMVSDFVLGSFGRRDGVRLCSRRDGLRLCSWFFRAVFETKNKVSCIGLVYTAPVDPSLKAVSLSTAGPEKVSSDGPLGD